MGEVSLNINGRNFGVACDDGQEQRVVNLGHYIDKRMKEIARAGAANNESHLLVLTALMLADEIYDLRDNVTSMDREMARSKAGKQDEEAIAMAIDELAERIDLIADRIQKA